MRPFCAAKSVRLDVHVTFNDGEVADLEMQVSKTDDNLRVRAEVYTGRLLSDQTRKGKRYKDTPRVYQIFFLNCVLYPKSTKLEQRVQDILNGSVKPEILSGEEKRNYVC